MSHPSGAYPEALRTLQPGQSVSFPILIVSVDWETWTHGDLGYKVLGPGRCKIRFVYTPPRITGEHWKAYSNQLVIDLER